MLQKLNELTDDYSLTRVPKEKRTSFWSVFFVRIGALTALSQLILGAALGYGMSFWDAFWATMLGSVILEVVSIFIGIAGAREGLSTSLLTRWTGFGKYGSAIVGAVLAVSCIGWFGIQNTVFAQGIYRSLHGAISLPIIMAITGLAVTVLVIYGFKWLSWTAYITVPAFLIVVGYGIYQVLSHYSIDSLVSGTHPGPALSLGAAATMVAGGFMAGAVITPDYTRFCKNGKHVFWMSVISIFLGELGVNMIGVLMAHAIRSNDVVTILLDTSGWLGAAIVILATVKINDSNLYSSSLGFNSLIESIFKVRINRGVMTLIVGVLGTILSMVGILDKFQGFLILLGVWIPPIGAILVVDYFILKTSRPLLDLTRQKGALPDQIESINYIALLAWVAGFLAGYYIQFGIPSVNALIGSGVVYYAGMKIKKYFEVRNGKMDHVTNYDVH
ncbi:cytosine permease [Sporolactobacillus sp. THM7-7]|nr:cytosine permease [Sporolactobacillus sp. THM7-7]